MNELSLQGVPGPVVVGASFIVMVLTATAIWRIAVFLKAALIRILPSRAAYNRRRYLMTKSELAFYQALVKACHGKYLIHSKVRIADVLSPLAMKNKKKWWRLFTQISSKHVDFVLCDPRDMSILYCIELDDRSHRRPERRKRDEFVNKAFAGTGLPLLRVPTTANYRTDDLIELIQLHAHEIAF